MSERSAYLRQLPAIYRGAFRHLDVPGTAAMEPAQSSAEFLGPFLKIFETILTEKMDPTSLEHRSFSEMIDALPDMLYPALYFLFPDQQRSEGERDFVPPLPLEHFHDTAHPGDADSAYAERLRAFLKLHRTDRGMERDLEELLEWLSTWTALVLHRNWSVDKKRTVLARILPLYRRRGTPRGLEALLELYFDRPVKIFDRVRLPAFRVGVNSRAGGGGATLGGFPPYHFIAAAAIRPGDRGRVEEIVRSIRRIIDREKPAHTTYNLVLRYPEDLDERFIVGHSQLNVNTKI